MGDNSYRTYMIDGVPYQLKQEFDLSFLAEYGEVFCCYDQQDSGNICFGVKSKKGKYFIKLSGANTVRSTVISKVAVDNLKQVVTKYTDLAHNNLVRLVDAKDVEEGFFCVFDWVEGISMGRMYPEDRKIFKELSIEIKHDIFLELLDFQKTLGQLSYSYARIILAGAQ